MKNEKLRKALLACRQHGFSQQSILTEAKEAGHLPIGDYEQISGKITEINTLLLNRAESAAGHSMSPVKET